MTQDKPALAALVVQVLTRRYPKQPMGEGEREDWLRAAMEGDPLVYLEAAWEWYAEHAEGKFRPYPGQLRREVSDKWAPDQRPYLSLAAAVRASGEEPQAEGLAILIGRMGSWSWDGAVEGPITPSLEREWLRANHEHRVWAFARDRMMRRGTPPWNPTESKGIAIPSGAHFHEALCQPARRGDVPRLGIGEALAGAKRLGGGE